MDLDAYESWMLLINRYSLLVIRYSLLAGCQSLEFTAIKYSVPLLGRGFQIIHTL